MSGNERKAVVYGMLGVAALTVLALAVHTFPWLRSHRVEISLTLLALIVLASGVTVAATLLFDLARTRGLQGARDPDAGVSTESAGLTTANRR